MPKDKDQIHVKVHSWGEGRDLMLRWTDPVTGKRRTRTAGTTDWKEAERCGGKLEEELRAGTVASPSKITWRAFLARHDDEKLSGGNPDTAEAYRVALGHVTRVLDPDRLAKLTTANMVAFVGKLRKEGMGATTIARHLRHIKAAIRWAHRFGYLTVVPTIDMPKAVCDMKGRPITTEEYERMFAATPKVRKDDAVKWQRVLTGLWLSGLRIGEAVALSWDDGPFQIDLDGQYPAFRIQPAGQKSKRAEIAPMTPDFAQWVLETPEAERTGRVFGITITPAAAGRVLSKIGQKANVVVDREMKKIKERVLDKAGKPTGATLVVEKEVTSYGSAHDLRRAFGTRWAQKVMPAVLQRLMRHGHISTTMKFYVGLDADEVAASLWVKHGPPKGSPVEGLGNKSGNIRPETPVSGYRKK